MVVGVHHNSHHTNKKKERQTAYCPNKHSAAENKVQSVADPTGGGVE